MKIFYVAGAAVFLASPFLYHAYAIELCESKDYYELANAANCTIKYNNASNKVDPQSSMFEIMKNYPFEKKDAFVKVLQRKIALVDTYITQQQGQKQTEKVAANISTLARAKQDLSMQAGRVDAATEDNWVSIRDQARQVLEEVARKLRDVE